MKFTGQYQLLGMMAGAAVVLTAQDVLAQVVTIDVDVDVLNSVTLAKVDDLNFGKIAAISDAAKTASLALDTAGAPTITTTGTPAYIATVDATNRKAAQITLEDAADGASLQVTIGAVSNPTNGAVNFTLSDWVYSFNGGGDLTATTGTPFAVVFSNAFGGGTNTLDVAAKITTNAAGTAYVDGNYDGAFNITVSY
jgi:hypothetical protein